MSGLSQIRELLGKEADDLLNHKCIVAKESIHTPRPDWVDHSFGLSDRNPQVMRSLEQISNTGRLAGTGYVSILPVDQVLPNLFFSQPSQTAPPSTTDTIGGAPQG